MSDALRALLTASAARSRSRIVLDAIAAGDGRAFGLDPSRMPDVAAYVAETTRAAYPDLAVPPHSRWRHFERADGGSDWADLAGQNDWESPRELAVARLDLAFVSVLLDAGAGAEWTYKTKDGRRLGRSEGLAAASLEMFAAGAFSSDPNQPFRVDAKGLRALTVEGLAAGMQSGAASTSGADVVGLEGRWRLLANLAAAMEANRDAFGDDARPGGLFDWVRSTGADAPGLLVLLLERLAPIWPQGRTVDGVALGDVWSHPAIGEPDATRGLVPFHKLSQWLAYSLTEPFADAGMGLAGIDQLTGLAEYRNGGLFVDFGVLQALDAGAFGRAHQPGDLLTVEWRAATLALLDDLLPLVRDALDAPTLDLPCMLQGGTWAAGRRIARERRPGGPPPFAIESDGVLF